jgi:hypothetical protein
MIINRLLILFWSDSSAADYFPRVDLFDLYLNFILSFQLSDFFFFSTF